MKQWNYNRISMLKSSISYLINYCQTHKMLTVLKNQNKFYFDRTGWHTYCVTTSEIFYFQNSPYHISNLSNFFFIFIRVFLIFCHICVNVDVATSQLPVSFGGKECIWMIASFYNGSGALCKDFSPFASYSQAYIQRLTHTPERRQFSFCMSNADHSEDLKEQR